MAPIRVSPDHRTLVLNIGPGVGKKLLTVFGVLRRSQFSIKDVLLDEFDPALPMQVAQVDGFRTSLSGIWMSMMKTKPVRFSWLAGGSSSSMTGDSRVVGSHRRTSTLVVRGSLVDPATPMMRSS
jgi:hypothetical protein